MGSRDDAAYLPIEDYALIGDGLTGALVSRGGSIDWACFPRFDSPSIFARILDARIGGSWALHPTTGFTSTRRYLPDTAILETTFTTAHGVAVVLDFMPLTTDRGSRIVRVIRCRSGRVAFESIVAPAFDYARSTSAWLAHGGSVSTAHGELVLTLSGDAPHSPAGSTATARFEVGASEERAFILRCEATLSAPPSTTPPGVEAQTALDESAARWRAWMAPITYSGPHRETVRRSALTLKLLDYLPTGAIIAAATTSLPERIGGVRNWDYRYTWLRDTAFTLYAFYVIGHSEESDIFLNWVMEIARSDPASLQVMYGLEGETALAEQALDHLEGYRGSKPVRIGNRAHSQLQLDIYGEILDCAYLFAKRGGTISLGLWTFLARIVDFVCDHWQLPDQGIWEVRSAAQHFVYSKALCWVAVDRGIRIAEGHGHKADLDRWRATASTIRAEVLLRGYDAERGSFMQAYDSDQLD
ncbi:MAG TPA: glycoside hydrolase family 15 protein, partial [Tepidiformaceae bacterium]|nr:glycoside hydrolase family 15 protein [Tepidiformaceae bacterium]